MKLLFVLSEIHNGKHISSPKISPWILPGISRLSRRISIPPSQASSRWRRQSKFGMTSWWMLAGLLTKCPASVFINIWYWESWNKSVGKLWNQFGWSFQECYECKQLWNFCRDSLYFCKCIENCIEFTSKVVKGEKFSRRRFLKKIFNYTVNYNFPAGNNFLKKNNNSSFTTSLLNYVGMKIFY